MNRIIQILMNRDGMKEEEATELLKDAKKSFEEDDGDPEEILQDSFGLEPDYLEDFLFFEE